MLSVSDSSSTQHTNSYTTSRTSVSVHQSGILKSKSNMAALPPPHGNTDMITQKAILEQLFLKRPMVGDFWYVIVAEWLEQLKRYVGIPTTRKYYNQRSHPGPIITRRDYAHTVDVVHEDVWRVLGQWYGLADGHKPIKLVVYSYSRGPELEHNLNSFKVMLTDSTLEDFQNIRLSKMEKVGHVEWKVRTIYGIKREQHTRLWAKPDSDGKWNALFVRDKSIGKVLDIDSDFVRPIVALEVLGTNGTWDKTPDDVDDTQDYPTGSLIENNIFEDMTNNWEADIHEQIDHIGKSLLDNLHMNFNAFVHRAKDYVDERDYNIRQRERDACIRESYLDDLRQKLEEKEKTLDGQLELCERQIDDYDKRKKENEEDYVKKREELDNMVECKKQELLKRQESFEMERDRFHAELTRMSEVYKIQENRIKLDVGGQLYTTSLSTLTRDPDSMLAAMFSGRHKLKLESDGSYFIDRDGVHFRYILNFLRDGGIKDGTLPSNENVWRELLTEAEYYQIHGLVEYLSTLLFRCGDRRGSDTFV